MTESRASPVSPKNTQKSTQYRFVVLVQWTRKAKGVRVECAKANRFYDKFYRFVGVWQRDSGKGPRLGDGAAIIIIIIIIGASDRPNSRQERRS